MAGRGSTGNVIKAVFETTAARPPAEVRHPDLGGLLREEGLWRGRVCRHGWEIPFVIGATEAGPDSRLLDRFSDVLAEPPGLEVRARKFLCPAQAHPVTQDDFTFQSVAVLWPTTPTGSPSHSRSPATHG